MAVVSAEVQRALERWVNQLRFELKDTKGELQEARRRADELEAECDRHRTAAKEAQQESHGSLIYTEEFGRFRFVNRTLPA